MHRVGIAGSASNSVRPRKEKRFTYVLNDVDDTKHCAGVNCLAVLKSSKPDNSNYLFTGSRDGTLKRWELTEEDATCSATFESHVDWVNDAVLAGGNTLVSCSSDTTVKAWDCFSDGTCTRTFRQHTDYVTCLAASEKNSNIVASGGLGGEVFIWDLEAALAPLNKSSEDADVDHPAGTNGSLSNNISLQTNVAQGYAPVSAKGHKESVYALAMNDTGTLLVSGGTEKAIRVWDSRSGSKMMKLRGHTDNIRALLLDSTGRFCLSGSSDSMIRLWDLGQQRCVHSYAVHTDSVWALASTPTFSHVYSGGRDLSLYLTDLATRESILLCTKEDPIQQLAMHDDSIWVATTDSSVHRWPAEGRNPQKVFQRGGSFLAGNLSFSRARASLEGSTPVPVYKEPTFSIDGIPGIVQYEIMNNRRHVLTKDKGGCVKRWEITKGVVVEDYGHVSFEKKKEELFEMVSIPAWFTIDSRLGNLSVHLDTPQCFSAEMYSVDLNITEKAEDDKINLARETLKGLLTHWLSKKKQKFPQNGEISSSRNNNTTLSKVETDNNNNTENDYSVYPPFEFSTVSPPSIITEGSQNGPWRKKITEMDGTEDEKDLPWWVLDCILHNRMPPREHTKCSFYLQPFEGSTTQTVTQGKLSAPRILRVHKDDEVYIDDTHQDNTQPDNTQLDNTQPENTQPENTQPENTQPENTQPENTQKKQTKKRKLRAECWNYFERIKLKTEEGIEELHGKCLFCSIIYKADPHKNGTTSLKRHFPICDKNPKFANRANKKQTILQMKKEVDGEGSINTWMHDEKRIKKALLNLFVVGELPFKFVENEAFIEYTNALNGKHFQIRCMAHILNLIVKDGLKEQSCHVEVVQKAVRYIRQSTQRIKKFKKCMKDCKFGSKKFLCGDCPTRWNSTHDSLKIAVALEDAFVKYEVEDKSYASDLGKVPEHSDFSACKDVVKFLEIFKRKTELVSGSSKPLAHLFIREVFDVNKHLRDWEENPIFFLMGKEMLNKYDKYWGDFEKVNDFMHFAELLDPTVKFSLTKHAIKYLLEYKKISDDDIKSMTDTLLKDIRARMDNLFQMYKQKCDTGEAGDCNDSSQEDINEDVCSDVGNVFFGEYLKEEGTNSVAMDTELTRYLDEPKTPWKKGFDILNWWKQNGMRFPILSRMAKDILAIQISTVASESAFSTGGRVLEPYRTSLSTSIVEALICTQDWVRKSRKPIIDNVDDILNDDDIAKEIEETIREHKGDENGETRKK